MKRFLILFVVSLLAGASLLVSYSMSHSEEGPITFWDYSYTVLPQVDTLEVVYINWACACPNWLPAALLENPEYVASDHSEDCIFLEASDTASHIPEASKGTRSEKIQLIGSFFKNTGISRDYEKPTSQKPEKARIFRYSSFKIIDGS